MSFLGKSMLYAVIAIAAYLSTISSAYAVSSRYSSASSSSSLFSGGDSLEFGLSTLSANQSDLNDIIKTDRTGNATSTSDMGAGYELFAQYTHRYTSTWYAFVFRPSYIMQSTTGSGNGGSYDYKLSGYTIFPMLRVYALENSFIKFFMQGGLGYGHLGADITQGAASISFSGGSFGAVGGIGVDFCFVESHCLTIEGNIRYLPIERNVASGVGGTPSGFSQAQNGKEVEINSEDLKTTLSGVQGVLAYTLVF